ncbi:MAG: hypothetical protein KME29_06930 [Calothrix sp. FI2-JRJ7]|jgi:hypothetical protein|nr:hypothetical protein [Calothrix sp. FI2-JRJ7]
MSNLSSAFSEPASPTSVPIVPDTNIVTVSRSCKSTEHLTIADQHRPRSLENVLSLAIQDLRDSL